jgi:hypothetical protein
MGHLFLSNLSIPTGSNLSIPEVDDRWQLRSYVTDEYVISSIKSTSFFRLLNSKQELLNNEKDQHLREILNEVFSTNNRDNQKFRHISIKKIKQVPNWETKCNNILKEIMKEHRPFGSSRGFHVFKFHNLYSDFIIRIVCNVWAQYTITKHLTPKWLEYYYSPKTGCGFKKSKTHFEVLQKGSNQRQIPKLKGSFHVNNYILIHILSFIPSYYFYKVTKSELLWRNYFGFKPEDKISLSLIREYVLLDYFLNRRHLLLLDEWKSFRIQFNEHYRPHCYGYQSMMQAGRQVDPKKTRQKDVSIESVQTSIKSVKNIARLTYFISCLRRIELHQRKCTKDKMEQTNIGMSFKILIDAVSKQSEIELEMIRAV